MGFVVLKIDRKILETAVVWALCWIFLHCTLYSNRMESIMPTSSLTTFCTVPCCNTRSGWVGWPALPCTQRGALRGQRGLWGGLEGQERGGARRNLWGEKTIMIRPAHHHPHLGRPSSAFEAESGPSESWNAVCGLILPPCMLYFLYCDYTLPAML